jgi:DMSO reductase family type II enzyme chaperone
MTTGTLEGLRDEDELRAAARSRAFGLFAGAFTYPEGEALDDVRSGRLAQALAEALGALDPGLAAGLDREALCDGGADDELAVEFTRLFDVGASGPPCPLYGGLWGGARMKTMEEAVRFYDFFGLKLAESPRELPDHVTIELEFLHSLAYREAEALQADSDADPYRRAQRDFIERHPGRWIPRLRAKLEGQEAPRFFLALVGALERLLASAQAELSASAGRA